MDVKIEEKPIKRRVILYAPTWEGTHDSMNYTSLNDFGLDIVQTIISNPELYLIYKPHPNTGSRDVKTKAIHNQIIQLVQSSHKALNVLTGDINALYPHLDLAIFDNSAVAIDYMIQDKPMLMTDMFHKIVGRQDKPTITHAARMLQASDMMDLNEIIEMEIQTDSMNAVRNQIKNYFLGDFDYSTQESTHRFVQAIIGICDERDELTAKLQTLVESKPAEPWATN